METFEPMVNVLVLLSVLSFMAERVTNAWKLSSPTLSLRKSDAESERDREKAIAGRTLIAGVVLALLVKANMLEIVANPTDPWQTIGWVTAREGAWFRSAALANPGSFLYALAGSVLTGLALGFGSKFWHDTLGGIYELRSFVRERRSVPPAAKKSVGGSPDA
ncbi:MAG: hypothetical protein ACRD35_08105 [Candidatus Acidiferrales bacterium]